LDKDWIIVLFLTLGILAILSKEIIEYNLNNVNQNENMVVVANSHTYGAEIRMLITKSIEV
jgi:hypothetical protein